MSQEYQKRLQAREGLYEAHKKELERRGKLPSDREVRNYINPICDKADNKKERK